MVKQRFFYVLIFISALFKIYWFLSVYGIIDATTIFIMTCYILAAILHMMCTGYAIFTFIFNRKINREHNKYVDSKRQSFAFNPQKPLEARLDSNDLEEVSVGRHKITKRCKGDFYLCTYGVLIDDELHQMIGRQPKPEPRRLVAIQGVKHQMLILQQTPVTSNAEGGTQE